MGRFKGIVYLTQAQYAALETKDEDTLYCINDKNVPIPTVADINKVVRVNAFGQYELAASPISDKQIFDINHPVNSEYQTSVETDMSTLSDGTWELVYHGNVGGNITSNNYFQLRNPNEEDGAILPLTIASPKSVGVLQAHNSKDLYYAAGLTLANGINVYIYKRIA